MSLFDIILLGVIGGFGLFGLWFGLVSTIGSILGSTLGVFLAYRFFEPLANWLMKFTGWTGNFPKVVMFIIAFLIINRLVGFGFFLLSKVLSIVTNLPFIHSINAVLGLAFGLFEGVLVVGILFYFINKFPLWPNFMTQLSGSKVAPYCVQVASILWPLIPPTFKTMQDSVANLMKI